LEEYAYTRSVPNWISYLHANSWNFSPFLSILIKFLKSKIDINFPKFSFEMHFKSGEVPMEDVVHLFKSFTTIFYFKNFDLGNALFRSNEV
jgi:hypothetical protein